MTNNNKALDESVRNIFSLPQVVDIERQILDLYRNMTHSRGDHRPGDGQKVKCGGQISFMAFSYVICRLIFCFVVWNSSVICTCVSRLVAKE